MKDFIVEAAYISLLTGKIKLTAEQYSARKHSLRETKEKDVYEIISPVGFKKGEVFSLEGDAAGLIKSGMIVDASPAVLVEDNSAAKEKKAAK